MKNKQTLFSCKRSLARSLAASASLALSIGAPLAADKQSASTGNQMELAKGIVAAFDKIFAGPHASMRVVHGQGILCEGIFNPAAGAKILSRAVHFQEMTVPIVVRFSNFASIPALSDGNQLASPRGMAIKFLLPDGEDTDIVAHSYNGFPVSSPEDFLSFLQAIGAGDSDNLDAFLSTHPAAKAFMKAPKPAPVSFATEAFYGVDAFRFINVEGVERFGRYRIEPVVGQAHLSASEAELRPSDYLSQDLAERLKSAPVSFRLLVQLPAPGDPVLDASVPWAEDRPVHELGVITIRTLTAASKVSQQPQFFTPLNLVSGIATSGDPLLIARTRAYRISMERRSMSTVARNRE